ncbi:MAG: acetyl-CoA carboxylase carboxyltransferase subunit alpha [Planctomycetes bacterium]|nr:acetyl-CoA carboxylase carboxyltransferase subunit alpha [Planctomycetota bacterium]
MADSKSSKNTTRTPKAHEVLDFERPIHELESKILELEALSSDTALKLGGEITPLKRRLNSLVQEVFRAISPWQQVQVARAAGRPLSEDFVEGMCDELLELHGDRNFRDDPAVLTAIARIGTRRVLIVAHRKGRDTREKIRTHFGCAHPEGYRKALRKMKLAEKFGLPIVALINTPGAYPGIGAEERGQGWAIAENLQAMFALKVPIISIVIGEGGSGGALGIGIADRVLMMEHSYYSVISPEGCAAILWGDAKRAPEAAKALRLCSKDLLAFGVVDAVLEEPVGAAHRAPAAAVQELKRVILEHLDELSKIPIAELLEQRFKKFRAMGTLFAGATGAR